jgi:hypothetical protein
MTGFKARISQKEWPFLSTKVQVSLQFFASTLFHPWISVSTFRKISNMKNYKSRKFSNIYLKNRVMGTFKRGFKNFGKWVYEINGSDSETIDDITFRLHGGVSHRGKSFGRLA